MINLRLGDCLQVMNTIESGSIDAIITDPPYGMSFVSNRRKQVYESIKNDNDISWLKDFYFKSYNIMNKNSVIYTFCSWHNVDLFKKEFEKHFKLLNILIWEKNNTSMGDLKRSYAPKYEMCLFGIKGDVKLKSFRYPDIVKAKRTNNEIHPTQKPVDLMKFFIENSTSKDQLVLDPFMGSGSTGVACKNLNRDFIGIELDKKYFDIAKERIENHKIQESFV